MKNNRTWTSLSIGGTSVVDIQSTQPIQEGCTITCQDWRSSMHLFTHNLSHHNHDTSIKLVPAGTHAETALTSHRKLRSSTLDSLLVPPTHYISKTALLGYRHYRPHDLCTGLYSLCRPINSVQLCKFLTTDTIATPILHFWLHFFTTLLTTLLLRFFEHFYYTFYYTFTTLFWTLLLHFFEYFYYTFLYTFTTLLTTLWAALVNPVMTMLLNIIMTTLLNLIITTLLNLVMTTLLNLIMTTLLSLIVTTLLNLINLPKV